MKRMTVAKMLTLALALCLIGSLALADGVVWRMANQHPEGSIAAVADQEVCDAIYEATEGRVKIDLYLNNALGDYLSVFDEVMIGSIEMAHISTNEAYDSRLLGTFLPYLNVMVLYFLVLFYGQGVASSVVLEKQSKLMDTFLLSVRPEAMVLGKLLAGVLAGMLQVLAWIVGAVGGLLLGSELVRVLYPAAQMGFLQILRLLGSLGLFAPGPSILALLLIVGGFLLYCSLAAVGGALAGKQADLGSTNSLFTMLLVASFLISILGKGSSSGQLISDASWMNYVPFTAVLTLPSRLVLGEASPLTGIVSLVIVLLFALAIAVLAGRLYTLLAFRKGDPPKIKDIPALLRGK